MRQFRSDELSFEMPEGWDAKTVIGFEGPKTDGRSHGPNVMLVQQPLRASESLTTFAAKKLASLASSLSGFELLERRDLVVGGVRAVQLHFKWDSAEGPMTQRMTMLTRSSVILSVAATGADGDQSKCSAALHHVLSTLDVGQRPSAAARAAQPMVTSDPPHPFARSSR